MRGADGPRGQEVKKMAKMAFKVRGMHCPFCEKILQMELVSLPGISAARADYNAGAVEVEGDKIDSDMVKKAIRDNGYKI